MAQTRDDAGQPALAGIGAQSANDVRAHKPGAGPGAKTHKVGTALDRLQRVVANLQTQQRQVAANGRQPGDTRGMVWRNHDAVVHVAPIVGHFQRTLTKVV